MDSTGVKVNGELLSIGNLTILANSISHVMSFGDGKECTVHVLGMPLSFSLECEYETFVNAWAEALRATCGPVVFPAQYFTVPDQGPIC